MLRILVTVCLTISTLPAFATDYSAPFFTIDENSLKIIEIDSGELDPIRAQEVVGDCSDLNGHSKIHGNLNPGDLVDLINLGKQVWQVIQNNKPVVNVTDNTANALPRGVACWTDLENWNAPRYKTYQITYENLFGMEVMNFKFQLFYSYGGQIHGTGKYLANVTVAPMELDVLWGFQFDAKVEVGKILNIGSHEDPMAGMELAMKWEAKSPLKDSRGQVRYFVQGDGTSNLYE